MVELPTLHNDYDRVYLVLSNKMYWCLFEGRRSPSCLYQIPARRTETETKKSYLCTTPITNLVCFELLELSYLSYWQELKPELAITRD